MRIRVEGELPAGVTAKDVILSIIAKVGANVARALAEDGFGIGIALPTFSHDFPSLYWS